MTYGPGLVDRLIADFSAPKLGALVSAEATNTGAPFEEAAEGQAANATGHSGGKHTVTVG